MSEETMLLRNANEETITLGMRRPLCKFIPLSDSDCYTCYMKVECDLKAGYDFEG